MMYRATRIRLAPVKNVLIWWFARHYQVNLSEARWPDLRHYPDFNSFFTRPLLPDARPVWSVPGSLCSPCDGVVSERRNLLGEWLVEAKGAAFSASDLLADPALARHLDGGDFLTIYLSPRDYHRVHVPCPSRLTTIRFIPGKLFSVRPRTVAAVPGLLARNERAVFELEADFGRYALVMVGALFVSSIETSLTGTLSAEGDAPQSFTLPSPMGSRWERSSQPSTWDRR